LFYSSPDLFLFPRIFLRNAATITGVAASDTARTGTTIRVIIRREITITTVLIHPFIMAAPGTDTRVDIFTGLMVHPSAL
jgi:hypothetical protein